MKICRINMPKEIGCRPNKISEKQFGRSNRVLKALECGQD